MRRRGPIAKIEPYTAMMYRDILNMSAAQRRTLRKQLDRLTATNCSWIIYHARPLTLSMLDAAQPHRWGKAKKGRIEPLNPTQER
jgi:hypothetical protein